MSDNEERLKRLVKEASGILAAANGKVRVTQAMKLVGFTTPERTNMKWYQQVRRKQDKLVIVDVDTNKPTAMGTVTLADNSQETNVSTLTGERSYATGFPTPGSNSDSSTDSLRRRVLADSIGKKSDKSPVAKVARRTSKDLQRVNAKVMMQTKRDKQAMKQATVLIERNKALGSNHPSKMSIGAIVDLTNERLNANISAKSAARYVRQGLIGVSPLKRGPVGDFEPRIYNALKGAFTTYLKLEQAASKKQSTIAKLSRLVNKCVNKAGHNKTRDDLAKKLKKDTADSFEVTKANVVEQRRLMWTTSYNLEIWFQTWKETLIDLGFARPKRIDEVAEGELVFYPGQTDRIGNLDETDGSLDDTTGQRGGRPPMTFYAPDIRGGGTAVNKSGYSATVICGSTAAGDPFPVHFQLKTLAQTIEGQRMSVDWFINTKNVIGKFGYPVRKAFPCTFGMNERAGMNAVELEKYLKNSILPLYPDIQDFPGSRVILKVDSGPGRLNVEMLADLRLQGMYLVPGVPNTTAVTQETDQNYGVYKTSFRDNLRKLSQCRFDLQMTLQVTDLPLLVFGGECPTTGVLLRDAFSDAFSIQRNLSCWKKCGAVPLTMAPLKESNKVRREVPVGVAAARVAGQDEDEDIELLKSLEAMNRFYCDILTANGLDGEMLRKNAPTRETYVAVTQPHSKERVKAIKDAKTAGQMFYATGGRHLNCNEFFQARELSARETKIKLLEGKKKRLMSALLVENAVMELLQEKGSLCPQSVTKFTVPEIKLLLKWKKVKPKSSKKADLAAAYYSNPPPLTAPLWTPQEEMELVALQSETTVDIKDTAIGRAAAQMAHAVRHNLSNIDPETRAQLKRALDDCDGSEDAPDPDGTTGQI
jgi:hypothetical protein